MTGEHHVDDLIEVQQGEYRDACAHKHTTYVAKLLCDIAQLENDLAEARAAAVAAFDGNALIQQAHHARDHYRSQIYQITEILADLNDDDGYSPSDAIQDIRTIVTSTD